uniref:Knottin scorpion toxin-like domain-containing protein n=1 Tax=Triticum urartu TaxID=4572 RepID=A0A8R7PJX9_TRIUA
MGVVKVPCLLCLLLLMPLLLVPGSEAETCTYECRTYDTLLCKTSKCVEACHKEGYTSGFCYLFPKICYYQKEC